MGVFRDSGGGDVDVVGFLGWVGGGDVDVVGFAGCVVVERVSWWVL